jgi:uncharacterized protein (TIGR03437 family)
MLALALCGLPSLGATIGTIVPHTAPLADIALDEARKRLYVLNATVSPPKVEIFNLTTKPPSPALGTSSIAVDPIPLSMALSPSRSATLGPQFLYVACYTSASIDVINLDTLTKVNTVRLSANPESVAVGYDGKVLIGTIGTSTGSGILSIYDPNASASNSVTSVVVAPAAPTVPTVPPPNSNAYLSGHSRMVATPDGKTIVGVHEQAAARAVWVYDVASATVLRSRTLNNSGSSASPPTGILAVSPDGSRFISGSILFDTASLLVLAQQSTSNAPFTFPTGANFATQTTQGGAVFTPDGGELLTAYNIVPVESPAAQVNTSMLLVNTPGNLLIQIGFQLPEQLSGKMVITSDGATIYAISESGFIQLPIGTLQSTSPIAVPDANIALLATDQCGVTAALNSATIPVRNAGGGKMTVTAQVLTTTSTSVTVKAASKSYGADVTVQINSTVSKTLGTATPDQLLIQSSEAVNIIPAVRIYQNNRNSEARGTIIPVDTGAGSLGLTDLVADTARTRLYIANPGLNRIEVFDTQQQQFLTPISVGQLPKSMALAGDGKTLYVANSGSEILTVVDVSKLAVAGTVAFPPLPFGSTLPIITPLLVVSTEQGPQVMMSDGSMWRVNGASVTPRTLNSLIFGTATTVSTPAQASFAASSEGAYALLLAGNGAGYLYSASDDDFIATRQIVSTPISSTYFGALSAGPNGAYFLVDGLQLNSSLTIVSTTDTGSTGGIPTPGGGGLPNPGGPTATTRPVSAVAAVNAQSFLRFSTPIRASASTAPTDAGLVELVDVNSQATTASANALEGPSTQVTGSARVNVSGRTMSYNAASSMVYAISTSGLSLIPMTPATTTNVPQVSGGGIVDLADFQPRIAPGGLFSIFGKNLASTAAYSSTPLPTLMGGVCVTLNNVAIPLLATSATQINAQVPPTLAAGTYPLVIRSVANQVASSSVNATVSKYAPAVFVDSQGAAIYHADGTRVDQYHPATRDEPLSIFATGLGVTTGGRVTAGVPSPSSPLAATASVAVNFGDPTISNSGVIVDWSGLVPGEIGVYQINCRIPGNHLSGNGLRVTLRIGGVASSTSGADVPLVYVD